LSGNALLWSGGKDSSLALRRSLLAGLEVRHGERRTDGRFDQLDVLVGDPEGEQPNNRSG
jgi:hypothetical protein